jgi:peptide-methionine (S)-S-oxide reductase
MLNIFWDEHDPTSPPYSRQYRSVILVQDDVQRELALKSKIKQEKIAGTPIYTAVESLTRFTLAENYHQKYYLRQRSSLMRDLLEAYPTEDEFIHATLSARLNAIAGGYESGALMQEVLANPLLSEATRNRLTGRKQRIF